MKKWVIIIVIVVLVAGCGTTGYAYAGKANQLDAANVEVADLSSTVSKLSNSISVLEEDVSKLNNSLEETNANLGLANEEIGTLNEEVVTLNEEVVTLNEEVVTLDEEVVTLNEEVVTLNEEVGTLESSLETAEAKYRNTANELAELQEFYEGIYKGEQPPYVKPDGQPMNMINLSNAQDPTWQQLVDFLNADQTDQREYVLSEYVCSGFTEDIHNNAEAVGIRSSIVHVVFEDSVITHVLNAFNTVDRGLVFIDCTGVTGSTNRSWDRVAFLRIGEQYGLIHLDTPIQSFEYEYYEESYGQLQQRIAEYELAVSQYNAEVGSYSDAVQSYNTEVIVFEEALDAYNQNPTYDEYVRLSAWQDNLLAEYNQLESWRINLDNQASSLNRELYSLGLQYDSFGGVLGVVKEVEMYW